jgi:hypothetical protein
MATRPTGMIALMVPRWLSRAATVAWWTSEVLSKSA